MATSKSGSERRTAPKSNKKREQELKQRRKARAVKAAAKRKADIAAFKLAVMPPDGSALCNAVLLAPHSPFDNPDFKTRGYYLNRDFTCRTCGKAEVWTATQQKWWFEIAKGGVWTQAVRCRPCRRREREQAAEHKKRSEEGKARKAALKAAGKWRTGL